MVHFSLSRAQRHVTCAVPRSVVTRPPTIVFSSAGAALVSCSAVFVRVCARVFVRRSPFTGSPGPSAKA